MQRSSEDTDPFEWEYEYDKCKDKWPTDIVIMQYLDFTCWESGATFLATEQRTPDWSCLRIFGIGGTSESVVKADASLIADEDW